MSSTVLIRMWILLLLEGMLVGCGANGESVELPAPAGDSYDPGTVTAVLLEDGRFDALVALMEIAEVLQGPPGAETVLGSAAEVATRPDWNHTVFAPTDDAFSELDPDMDDCLFAEDNATPSLRIHLVQVPLHSADFVTENVQTLGGFYRMEVTETGVTFAGAEVIESDIEATNGVIHALDSVNLPERCTTD